LIIRKERMSSREDGDNALFSWASKLSQNRPALRVTQKGPQLLLIRSINLL
jgi:hypothetical protein